MTTTQAAPTQKELESALARLNRDIKEASRLLTDEEARFLVDSYYGLQRFRIRTGNQISAMSKREDLSAESEPADTIIFFEGQFDKLENQIKSVLDSYSTGKIVGRWSRSIVGIGPVLAAGLLAHIDITKAPTVGHIWRFGGLDPTVTWEKKNKRPWNASLKTLFWKIGESYVKTHNNPNDIYGHIYAERKALEISRNEAGEFAEQAAAALAKKRFGDDTTAKTSYKQGKLPPAHIHARAKRYAVKIFLSHWHAVAYEVEYGKPPPKPYVITNLQHAHYLAPPNWPM